MNVIDEPMISELVENLRKEAGHYRRLRELGEQQKEILVTGDLKGLPENVKASEKEVFALGPLNESRTKALSQLGRSLGLAEPTLVSVAEKLPASLQAPFAEAVREVVEAAKGLDGINRGNEKLLENAVQYVNFTLKALSDGGRSKSTYTPESLKPAAGNNSSASMLNRVI